MKTHWLYSNTYEHYCEERIKTGKTPWIKIGQHWGDDLEKYLRKHINQCPENPTYIQKWPLPSGLGDKQFFDYLEFKGVKRLNLGAGTEWFELHPDDLPALYTEWTNNLDWRNILRREQILESVKESESKQMNSISDIDWTIHCLKDVLVKDSFESIGDLQSKLLKLDRFGIYHSGLHAVSCAIQPFVFPNELKSYQRSCKDRQWAAGVRIRQRKKNQVVIEIFDGRNWDQV